MTVSTDHPVSVAKATPPERRAHIGSYVLESLTTGMYGEPRHAIREYVQNAYDAIRRARKSKWLRPDEGTVVITLDEVRSTLTIRDDGTGVSSNVAWQVLSSVGASSKDRREQAGFRGIGRLAGIAYCEKLHFITKYRGETDETTVTFDCVRFRRGMNPEQDAGEDVQTLLTEAITDSRRSLPADQLHRHYTRVIMEDLSAAPPEITDIAELRSYLSQTAPVDFREGWPFADDIRRAARDAGEPLEPIRLELHHYPEIEEDYAGVSTGEEPNEGEVEAEDPSRAPDRYPIVKPYRAIYSPNSRKPVKVTGVRLIRDPARSPKWWGWIGQTQLLAALKDDDSAGLRIRMRNIQIDGTAITDLLFADIRASYDRFNYWYIGELHIISNDVIPNARRDGFEENNVWRTIKNELEPTFRDLASKPYSASTRRTKIKKLAKEAETFVANVTARLNDPAPLEPDDQQGFLDAAAEVSCRVADTAAIPNSGSPTCCSASPPGTASATSISSCPGTGESPSRSQTPRRSANAYPSMPA